MRARLYLLATAAVLLVACGGDDPDPDPVATPTASAGVPSATPFPVQPSPTIVAAATDTVPQQPATYIVEPGDSLSVIAERFDTTVEAIMAANDIADGAIILVGQELRLPTADPAEASATATATPAAGDVGVYVVQAGDTAWAIANAHGTTIGELALANDLTVDELAALQPGDSLNLPRPQ
ncbi:MAG TPA: LysM peptidoglycan-binding domain-containing protein [Dehalococcoidia bacterium]|jgi:LysM repeat protein|nr:LysM peptidoglycan-binding domain-containing protein [Dehalococcoidia bacterium]